jgi:transposase-like protein
VTAVVDISCPNCDRTEPVRKRDLDHYYCADCGTEFGHEELL